MRIGFDAKRAFHNFSGLGNYSRNTIQILSQYHSDNEFFLYTPKAGESFLNSEVNIIQPVHKIHQIFKSYWRTLYLTNRLYADKLDIYHGLSNELPQNINKSPIKSIVTIHDLIFIRYPELYKPLDRYIYNKKFKYACQSADKIIAISKQTREDIVDFFNVSEDKISVVYQGCNSVYANRVSDGQKKQIKLKFNLPAEYILYVGTIEKRKNLLNIIKAIHEGGINIPLVAVGKQTNYVNEIRSYIDKHSVKNIILTGSIELHELPALYQMADLFVYPSIFEGFGIPILEALNSGIPVITSKGSCFNEAGGKDSIYIDPFNTEELIVAIKKTLSDSEMRNRMIVEGYKHASFFRNDKIADKLMNEYRSML